MFEEPSGNPEKDRSRLIMILSGAAVVVVIGLIILINAYSPGKEQGVELARPGTPEFEAYAPLVTISTPETSRAEQFNHHIAIIRCFVENTGDRIIEGLELRGWIEDGEGKLLKEKTRVYIPTQRETLLPKQRMRIEFIIERIPEPDTLMAMRAAMKVEVSGLKVK